MDLVFYVENLKLLSLDQLDKQYNLLHRTMRSFKNSNAQYFKIMIDMVDNFAEEVQQQYLARTVSFVDPLLVGCRGYIYQIQRTMRHNRLQITIKFHHTGHKFCKVQDIKVEDNDEYFQRI